MMIAIWFTLLYATIAVVLLVLGNWIVAAVVTVFIAWIWVALKYLD